METELIPAPVQKQAPKKKKVCLEVSERERLRKKLHALVKKAMAKDELDYGNLKIAYELLLKDEAAQLERDRFDLAKCAAAKPAQAILVTQDEFVGFVQHTLGKEITI